MFHWKIQKYTLHPGIRPILFPIAGEEGRY